MNTAKCSQPAPPITPQTINTTAENAVSASDPEKS